MDTIGWRERRITKLEAEVKEQAEAIKAFHDVRVIDLNELADTRGRMVLLRDERDELRVEVERLGGLLDEVQDLCKVQENFPFRGHLEDILAKRNQGKDGW